jgi:hypothetical protein
VSGLTIPVKQQLITAAQIPQDPDYGGLRIVRYQTDEEARTRFSNSEYEFQHEPARRHVLQGVTLALKGAPSDYRVVATVHPTLREFVDIVKYDPAHPPLEDYDALEMRDAHEQTQSDFKNQKLRNLDDFKQYNVEAMRGERVAYLPTISGWQSSTVFEDTIFVAFDENNPRAMYGTLYLPKKPVMQSDGQTQTAALFATAATGAAIKFGGLDAFTVTLEIELNVEKRAAAQSFADRNGRGSKKNKNLVARYDTASALAQLREDAIAGTVFANRLADGRTTGTTETATTNIVDLSTIEQMLLNAVSGGRFKPEHIKHYQVGTLVPYARDFLELLESQFAAQWPEKTPDGSEPFRRLYVHGWAFALKALALAYYDVRKDELGPICDGIAASLKDEHESPEDAKQAFLATVEANEGKYPAPDVDREEFVERLSQIDWLRYRRHWVALTGAKIDKASGTPKQRTLKTGETVVDAKAENTPTVIAAVRSKILSDSWTDLTASINA